MPLLGKRWIGVWILMASTAVLFRLYPMLVYPQIQAYDKARLLIYGGIRKSVHQSVTSKTNKPSADAQEQIENQAFQKIIQKDASKIRSEVSKLSKKIEAHSSLSLKPFYLMEVDPYYYFSLTKQLLDDPSTPVKKKGRNYFNPFMLAPNGAWYPMDLHPYTGYWLYKILSVFDPQMSLMFAVGLVPVLLAIFLSWLFIVLWKKIFKGSLLSALTAGFYLLLCPMYLNRSLIGWYDTDSYNILLPLLTACFLVQSLKNSDEKKSPWLWIFAGILSMAVHSLFWRGWVMPFSFFALALLATCFLSRRHFKNTMLTAVFLAGPMVFVPLFWGPQEIWVLWTESHASLREFTGKYFNVWPDVFVTVGELRPSDWQTISGFLGGPLLCAVSLGGFFSLFFRKKKIDSWAVFLGSYFIITFFSGLQAERFILFCVIPTALGLGLAVEKIFEKFSHTRYRSTAILRWGFLAILITTIFMQAHANALSKHPIYNPSWDRVMKYLKVASPADSIVTSWWSPGHFITAMSQRRVTFDGATQNTPQAYWVAKFFMERDEKKALPILRMLNLSGNRAFDLLKNNGFSDSRAIDSLQNLLPLTPKQATEQLAGSLPAETIEELLKLTHPSAHATPSYVLIYEDMIRQIMAMEYIGYWDFKKAEQFSNQLAQNPSKIQNKQLSRSSKEHTRLLWSMTEGPYYEEGEVYEVSREKSSVRFTSGLTLDLATLEAKLPTKTLGGGKPKNVYSVHEGRLVRKESDHPDVKVSVLLIQDKPASSSDPKDTRYRAVVADERLIESMAFRLYYLKGETLGGFRLKLVEDNPETRNRLLLYEVIGK